MDIPLYHPVVLMYNFPMKKVGVLVIHGIGTTDPDYDLPFKKRLFAVLKKLGHDPTQVAYQRIFWAEYIDRRQNQYLSDILDNLQPGMGLLSLRKFIITSLSDAACYQRKYGQSNQNYNNIIRRIHEGFTALKADLGNDSPIVILAHSLGAFIINNYIWDAHKIHDGHEVDWPSEIILKDHFDHMINVAGMITFGCNIPLFVIGNDPIEAIRFPHPEAPLVWKSQARWDNYYDPQDILGWPLRELKYSFDGVLQVAGAKGYPDVVAEDHVISVGGWLLGWTPWAAHGGYWRNVKFIHEAAKSVARFL